MKKIGLLVVFLFFMSTLITTAAVAVEKFGVIDARRIFDEYGKTKQYEKQLQDKQERYKKEIEDKLAGLRKEEEKLSLLSESERERRRESFEKRVGEFQEFQREKGVDFRKEYDEKMREIFKDIKDTIEEYAKNNGFTVIFQDEALAYSNKRLDVTDDIIRILKKKR